MILDELFTSDGHDIINGSKYGAFSSIPDFDIIEDSTLHPSKSNNSNIDIPDIFVENMDPLTETQKASINVPELINYTATQESESKSSGNTQLIPDLIPFIIDPTEILNHNIPELLERQDISKDLVDFKTELDTSYNQRYVDKTVFNTFETQIPSQISIAVETKVDDLEESITSQLQSELQMSKEIDNSNDREILVKVQIGGVTEQISLLNLIKQMSSFLGNNLSNVRIDNSKSDSNTDHADSTNILQFPNNGDLLVYHGQNMAAQPLFEAGYWKNQSISKLVETAYVQKSASDGNISFNKGYTRELCFTNDALSDYPCIFPLAQTTQLDYSVVNNLNNMLVTNGFENVDYIKFLDSSSVLKTLNAKGLDRLTLAQNRFDALMANGPNASGTALDGTILKSFSPASNTADSNALVSRDSAGKSNFKSIQIDSN